jgi:hypothetical protein
VEQRGAHLVEVRDQARVREDGPEHIHVWLLPLQEAAAVEAPRATVARQRRACAARTPGRERRCASGRRERGSVV